MGSFGEVLSDLFGNLFSSPFVLFALLALVGILVGWAFVTYLLPLF